MKKIIIILILIILGVGGWFYYKSENQFSIYNPNPKEEVQKNEEVDPEKIIQETDELETDEEELDAMIDELENMEF